MTRNTDGGDLTPVLLYLIRKQQEAIMSLTDALVIVAEGTGYESTAMRVAGEVSDALADGHLIFTRPSEPRIRAVE